MSYLKRKKGSLESSIISVWTEKKKRKKEKRLEWQRTKKKRVKRHLL